jgi:hypothetical protein
VRGATYGLLLGGKDGELLGGLELLDEVLDAVLERGHLLWRHEARQHGVAVLLELLLQLLKLSVGRGEWKEQRDAERCTKPS